MAMTQEQYREQMHRLSELRVRDVHEMVSYARRANWRVVQGRKSYAPDFLIADAMKMRQDCMTYAREIRSGYNSLRSLVAQVFAHDEIEGTVPDGTSED